MLTLSCNNLQSPLIDEANKIDDQKEIASTYSQDLYNIKDSLALQDAENKSHLAVFE